MQPFSGYNPDPCRNARQRAGFRPVAPMKLCSEGPRAPYRGAGVRLRAFLPEATALTRPSHVSQNNSPWLGGTARKVPIRCWRVSMYWPPLTRKLSLTGQNGRLFLTTRVRIPCLPFWFDPRRLRLRSETLTVHFCTDLGSTLASDPSREAIRGSGHVRLRGLGGDRGAFSGAQRDCAVGVGAGAGHRSRARAGGAPRCALAAAGRPVHAVA